MPRHIGRFKAGVILMFAFVIAAAVVQLVVAILALAGEASTLWNQLAD
ncbi:hypothetical protein M8R20_16585 [Pseudomonas sp. R2.Fl]|nr:hypothetical protein [Pseudomonas sp. R2.Fl]